MSHLDSLSSQTHIPRPILETLADNARFALRLKKAEADSDIETQRVLHIATLAHTYNTFADHPFFGLLGEKTSLRHVPYLLAELLALFPTWTENHGVEGKVCEFCAILQDIEDDQTDLDELVKRYNAKGLAQ